MAGPDRGLVGTMGPRTEKGFTLAGPGLQVFERKPKVDTAAATDTPHVEPVPPAVPAAPVIVATKVGTATVTKRRPMAGVQEAAVAGAVESGAPGVIGGTFTVRVSVCLR